VIALVLFDERAAKKVGMARSNMKDNEGASKRKMGDATEDVTSKERTEKERANVSTTKCQHLENIKSAYRERKKDEGNFHQHNTTIKMTKRRKKELMIDGYDIALLSIEKLR